MSEKNRVLVEGKVMKRQEEMGGLMQRSYWKLAAAQSVSRAPGSLTGLPYQ